MGKFPPFPPGDATDSYKGSIDIISHLFDKNNYNRFLNVFIRLSFRLCLSKRRVDPFFSTLKPGGVTQEGGAAPLPAGAQQLGQTNFAGFPAALPYVVQWQMNNWGAARVPAPLAAQYQQMLHQQTLMQPGHGVLPPQVRTHSGKVRDFWIVTNL